MYTTRGDLGAFLIYPYLYNPLGEWIGFANSKKEIFNLEGYFVGIISSDQRILRKKYIDNPPARHDPPPAPRRARAPASIPLPPQMAEISYDFFDVLEEKPELLHTLDSGEFKKDVE
jgi:hypothetical protein